MYDSAGDRDIGNAATSFFIVLLDYRSCDLNMQRFSDNKAGMSGLDKEKIQKIIEENTSANYEGYSRKQTMRINARISRNENMLKTFTSQQIAKAKEEMDAYVDLLEEERVLSRIAIHVDMDAFYAAVEMRDDPSLRSIPMAVGGDSMLSTSNYVARRFGIRAAMPGFIAKKLCPELKIIPCNFDKYKKASKQARLIFEEYDSKFSMGSLDEAYMDITDCVANRIFSIERQRVRYMGKCICKLPLIPLEEQSMLGDYQRNEEKCEKCGNTRIVVHDTVTFGTDVEEIVREMRFRVEQATGLTCSAGIAPNSMIAKICSDMNKPNGQFRVMNDKQAVLEFMRNLPIRKVSGIGAVTETILKALGIEKCGDLYEKRAYLSLLFSQRSFEHFLRIALGISSSYTAFFTTDRESRRKSISNERTFHPTNDMKKLLEIIKGLCNELIEELPKHNITGGRSATCKMKFSTFDLITRCTTVNSIITDSSCLYAICEKCIKEEMKDGTKQLRLLGVQLSKLVFVGDKVASVSRTLSSYFKSGRSEETDLNYDSDTSNDMFDISMPVEQEQQRCETFYEMSKIKTPQGKEWSTSTSGHICPICETRLPVELNAINRHVDECLNRKAILDLQNEETKIPVKEALQEKKTLAMKFQKRRHLSSGSKTDQQGAKRTKTISDYFIKK